MSIDISAIVERARIAAADARKDGAQPTSGDREKLKTIAAEFESMLLLQMLRDMRKAGQWDETNQNDTYGAETLFETIDVELSTYLARAKGMGLKEELLAAFDRSMPKPPTTESAAGGFAVVPGSGFQRPGSGSGSGTPNTNMDPGTRTVEPAPSLKPVNGEITSAFGWRRDPFTGRAKFHQGVDVKAAYGQEVQAAGAGTVVFSGEAGGYGTSVVIEHQDGTRTRYAHLSAALVEKGDAVGAGEAVGRAGRSGRATGTHLHFEVMDRQGRRVPPQQWATLDVHMTGLSGD